MAFLLGHCTCPKYKTIQYPIYLIDYTSPDGHGTPQLWAADSLKHAGQYEQTAQQYVKILENTRPTVAQRTYLLNQLVQIHAIMGQWDKAETWQVQLKRHAGNATPKFDNDFEMGDYLYNCAEIAAHHNQVLTSKKYYLEALRHQQAAYGANLPHYKLAQTYTALGEWFAEFNPDSSYIFISKAEEIYSQWDTKIDLRHYKIRHELAMAKLHFFERGYKLGVAALESVIELAQQHLYMNPEFVAKCHFAVVEHLFEDSIVLEKAKSHLAAGKIWVDKKPTDMGQQIYMNTKGTLLCNLTSIAKDTLAKSAYQLQMDTLAQEMTRYFADSNNRPRHVFLPLVQALFQAYGRGQFRKAIQYYHQAEGQFLKDSMCNLLQREMIQHGLTRSYKEIKDYNNAIKYAKRYILFGSKLENRDDIGWDSLLQPQLLGNKHYLYVHYNLAGDIYLKKFESNQNNLADLERAYQIYCTIDTLIDRSLFSSSDEAIIRIIQKEGQSIYGNAITCAYWLHQIHHSTDKQFISNAFSFMEKQKAYLLRTKSRKGLGLGKAPEGYVELLEQIQSEYQKELRKGIDPKTSWSNQLAEDLNQKYPGYNLSNTEINNNSLKMVQQTLPDKSAIVEYFSGNLLIFALVITKDTTLLDTVCNAKILKKAIDTTRIYYSDSLMAVYRDDGQCKQFAHLNPILSKALLGSIYPYIRNADTLIIIRDKQINEVVFETLFEPQPPVATTTPYHQMPFLLWRHNIVHSPSYWWHNRLKVNNLKQPIRVQAFANEDFRWFLDSLNVSMPNATTWGGKTIVRNRNEFIGPLKDNDSRDMICIYAHGTGAKSADKCSLIFSNSLQVQGSELQDVKLNGELVVLVACEAAQGQGQDSEDIHTLTWYLQCAGAGTTISSYTKIQAENGGEVLHAFLRHIDKGTTPDRALCAAKREYLLNHQGDLHTFAPYFWGTLVCSQ